MAQKMAINDPLSVPFALSLAQSYADMGLSGYNRLGEAFHVAQNSGEKLTEAVTTGAVSSAMTLAFSAELFVKVLHFQRSGVYPRGHDLAVLINGFPEELQASLEARYNEIVDKKPNILSLRYEMFEGEGAPPSSELIPRVADRFEEAIALASPLFVKLRYLYEEVTPGFCADIDFRWLIFLIEACRLEIDQFAGPGKITYKQSV